MIFCSFYKWIMFSILLITFQVQSADKLNKINYKKDNSHKNNYFFLKM
ncbi:hypothetical protein [uncultured Buchnera sp.]|jgi:hypothetical protein|nr:hypothetical protein [uncultured Buchnera sp.]